MAVPRYNSHAQNLEYMVLPIPGQRTATVAEVIAFDMPFDAELVHLEATARASGGTAPTLTVDIQQGTTSLLSTPVAVTAAARAEATLAAANTVTKDSKISIDLNIGGTSPTWDDVTVTLVWERR